MGVVTGGLELLRPGLSNHEYAAVMIFGGGGSGGGDGGRLLPLLLLLLLLLLQLLLHLCGQRGISDVNQITHVFP